jgi:hypothetical protein
MDSFLSTSRLSNNEIVAIWNLINIKSASSINLEQFIYFMHIVMSRRRGRPIPIGLPLDIKEEFLKQVMWPSLK